MKMELEPPGKGAGYVVGERQISVLWGSRATGQDFCVEESGIPLPEFTSCLTALLLAALLVATVAILRRNRKLFSPVSSAVA